MYNIKLENYVWRVSDINARMDAYIQSKKETAK